MEIPDMPLPAGTTFMEMPTPTFVGHYWLDPDTEKRPVADCVACLDYSAGKGGPLVAYRWNGEQQLSAKNFISVQPN